MKALALFAIAGIVAIVACKPGDPVPPPPPGPLGPDTCEAACAGLRAAKCREGFETEGGASCETVCAASSNDRQWPKACWAGATTRAEILRCGKTRCRPLQ
jgi:hypothetical protein